MERTAKRQSPSYTHTRQPANLLSWMLAALTAILLNCGGPDAPVVVETSVNTEVDFLYLYDEGRFEVSNEAYAQHYSVTINDDHRWVIFEHAPNTLRFPDVYIGSNAVMEFAIALLPSAWDKAGDGVRFEIALETVGNDSHTIYSRYIDPKANEEDRAWLPERVAIEEIADVTANVLFRTFPSEEGEGGDAQFDHAVWAKPRLISEGRPTQRTVPKQPNVLLITLDTTRADFLSCYGAEWVKTPYLDRLAEEGVLFENAFSVSNYTNPSHLSILSSLYPFTHEIANNLERLRRPIPTLPLIMKEFGYTTGAALSVSHLDNIMGGQMDGVDHYLFPSEIHTVRPDFMTVSAVIETLDEIKDEPFFLWTHFFYPHTPYKAVSPEHRMYYEGDPRSPAHDSMERLFVHPLWSIDDPDIWIYGFTDYDYFVREYGAEITSQDRQIGRLIDALERLNMRDDTLVIVTADHGESFGEHGIHFDHWTLHQQDIHVPLIISHPSALPQGVRIEADVVTVDIAPTILDVIGEAEAPMGQAFEGTSLRALWEGGELPPRLGASDGPFGNATAAWDERYKVIWEMRDAAFHEGFYVLEDRVWVYDRLNDPTEQNPLTVFKWHDDGNIESFIPPDTPPEMKPFVGEEYHELKELKKNKRLPSEAELRDWLARQGVTASNGELAERVQTLMAFMLERTARPGIYERIHQISGMATWLSLFDEDAGEVDPAMIEHLRNLGYIQ